MGAISRSELRRRARLRLILVVSLLIGVLLLAGALSAAFIVRALTIAHLQAELRALYQQEEALLQERAELEALLAKRNDPDYIEYLARKELGLIKPGEEKYIIIDIDEE